MKFKTRDIILVGVFAALTAIGAFIKIPTPIVPVTVQFVFCAFSGLFLGAKLGSFSQLLYVGIGLSGIPIFTQGGGLSYIFQPTFGFLIGFIFCSYIIGKFTEKLKVIRFKNIFLPVVLGLATVYAIGLPYLYFMIRYYVGKPITFMTTLKFGFFPFIIQDLCWCVFAGFVATKVIPSLRKAGYIGIN